MSRGLGTDELTYATYTTKLWIKVNAHTLSGIVQTGESDTFDPTSIEAYRFGSGNDRFDCDNFLRADGIGFQIYGGDGNDTLYGTESDDVFHGESGMDIINGRAGADALLAKPAKTSSMAVKETTPSTDPTGRMS